MASVFLPGHKYVAQPFHEYSMKNPRAALGRGVREGPWIWQNTLTPPSGELWVLKTQGASSRRAGRSPKVGNENRGSFPQTNTPQKVETAILKHTVIYFLKNEFESEQAWTKPGWAGNQRRVSSSLRSAGASRKLRPALTSRATSVQVSAYHLIVTRSSKTNNKQTDKQQHYRRTGPSCGGQPHKIIKEWCNANGNSAAKLHGGGWGHHGTAER